MTHEAKLREILERLRGADRFRPDGTTQAMADINALWKVVGYITPSDMERISAGFDGVPSVNVWATADEEDIPLYAQGDSDE